MDFTAAFTFITKDKDWPVKILIGSLLALTGIGMIPLMGWMVEISKRVANNDPDALPEWDNIGDLFINGLKLFGVSLVWLLPMMAIFSCAALFSIIANPENSGESNVFGIMGVTICISLFFVIYALALNFLLPALIGMVGEGRDFVELLNPKNSFTLFRANTSGFIIATVVTMIALVPLNMLGMLACMIGIYPAMTYGYTILAHFSGQAYQLAKANLAMDNFPEE
ncbi:MAG: DUF4013 domain-containing protein [Anaerolineae bacterium]|nr:DUF4013 domain-containing protein [Anaerolineae bacterium]